ncbi:prepilin-type N-terminal cleavage/methylation domain-containing protein [uncultured Vibrio sp.]|uniref:prepilin-type N-terminal cleavage/methylation domain-containing protein n=1 Tax=uncultured Vibrio sp. TaxID=114054 RepID=UPI000A68F8E5|nr:prepilin-type N-terminal cleavage/methylation domain-containing protein [uncultured Vibrio sp.]
MRLAKGFTLIESIIAIVIMGFAMVTLTSFLYPQIERSAASQYQTRSVTLGQSMISQILARGFDENSDLDGGMTRCGEPADGSNDCTVDENLGADTGETDPEGFNDVDDYIGCWKGTNAIDCAGVTPEYDLSDVLGGDVSDQYKNFIVTVDVNYVDPDLYTDTSTITSMKKVTLSIQAGKWASHSFVGYRGNY